MNVIECLFQILPLIDGVIFMCAVSAVFRALVQTSHKKLIIFTFRLIILSMMINFYLKEKLVTFNMADAAATQGV